MAASHSLLLTGSDALFQSFKTSPYSTSVVILSVICAVTRLLTGFRASLGTGGGGDVDHPKRPTILPYWIPWLGHTIQFGWGFQEFVGKARVRSKQDTFALVIGGTRHNFVTQPSMVKEILSMRSQTSTHDSVFYVMEQFFDDQKACRNMDQSVVWGPIDGVLNQLTRNPFLATGIAATVKGVEDRTWNLISFGKNRDTEAVWEKLANVTVLSSEDSVAEVSLYPLIRDFVADVVCQVLMGKNFMENNPTILQDLFDMDDRFTVFLLGAPNWLPGMSKAVRARERVLNAIGDQAEAVMAHLEGKDPGSRWSDLSDVSNTITDRVGEYKKAGGNRRAYSTGNAAIVWAANVNANQVAFWMLWHVNSQPDLLEAIRKEISPYVKMKKAQPEKSSSTSPQLSVDIDGLMTDCPLLSATFLETMRLNSLSSSVKKIMEDFTVTESREDAAMQGRQMPNSYQFQKGDVVWLPHASHQRDDRYWPDPDAFNPKRFWVVDEKKPSKVSVDYLTMKVWGGGPNLCKGRSFAEREVIAFTAGIFMLWDIETLDGKWSHPGHRGSGTAKPAKSVRVRMRRRNL